MGTPGSIQSLDYGFRVLSLQREANSFFYGAIHQLRIR
jgi:hypothetical protein